MKKILIIQTAFIGDAVLTLPMIQKLKEGNSKSQINVLCIPSTEEIFTSCPFVDNVLIFDKRGKHKSISGLMKFGKKLKEYKYDKIYSPHRSLRTSFLVLFSGVRDTFGFSISSFKHAYKYLVEYHLDKHEVQRNLDLIGYSYTDESWKIKPMVKISEQVSAKVNDYLNRNNIKEGFIAISPGSVWATKRYPEEYFIQVIKFFVEEKKQIVLIGGENDSKITSAIKNKFPEMVDDSAGVFSLIESIELIGRSSILITNDSAPTHLGMCADIKVLTLYCSTVAGFGFYPYNKLSRYLSEDDLYCKPCGIHGYNQCPIKTFECGFKLTPEKIIKIIKEMID
ncbi:MAG TPA: glycosyltransferase family 9 protein [Ignavibacteriaceae bacterium]|nr:glycosyltransferase family 9 protein [Ignavibacteriaceae bacterium]